MANWKSAILQCYFYGSLPYRHWYRQCAAAQGRLPVVVLFYHRVADDRANAWTTSTRNFARQIAWLRAHCDLVSLAEAQRRIASGSNCRPCASITFDDGYADNCRQAIPLLLAQQIPCTYFATVQNVLEGRPFPHDLADGNHFAPNTLDELQAMAQSGIEIGVHTCTHADLGCVSDLRHLKYEVVSAKQQLEDALGRPMRYFAFPFGLRPNLNRQVFRLAREVGYDGVCSAYGAYNRPGDDPFHIHRIHVDDDLIHLKNWVTIDPRKLGVPRFVTDDSAPRAPLAVVQEVS